MAKRGGGGETTAVLLITLGFMTLGVWHERDSGIWGGAENFGDFSQTRELKIIKSEERRPILVSKCGTLSNEIFRNPGEKRNTVLIHDSSKLIKECIII